MNRWCVVGAVLAGLGGFAPGQESAPAGMDRLDFREVIRQAKGKVFPAVVFVKCVREGHESGKRESQEVGGSGVIISPDGEVLTNWHVVDKAISVRCLLSDGRAMTARVLGTDKDIDLALLRLEDVRPDEALPSAPIGDSEVLKEGDFVMAMGAPWGMNRSVSIGIVSCTRRFLPQSSQYSLWLQTDAAISPGNSGGPLVNTEGQIVGINTLGVMFGGDMGFAIPSDTIRQFLPQIRQFSRMNWSWTGLQLQPLRDFNRNIYFDAAEGVIVAGTDPRSPASEAGVQAKDRILRIDGTPVNAVTEEDLPGVRRRLGLLPRNESAVIDLVRDGTAMSLRLVPREKGKVEGDELDCPRWDLAVKTINQFDTPDLHFHRQEGVFVFGVKSPGNAAASGLRERDILLRIDERDVTTLDDVRIIHAASLEQVRRTHRLVFTVLRNGQRRQVVLDISRDYEKE